MERAGAISYTLRSTKCQNWGNQVGKDSVAHLRDYQLVFFSRARLEPYFKATATDLGLLLRLARATFV